MILKQSRRGCNHGAHTRQLETAMQRIEPVSVMLRCGPRDWDWWVPNRQSPLLCRYSSVPELNDVLHLQHKGITKLENLDVGALIWAVCPVNAIRC